MMRKFLVAALLLAPLSAHAQVLQSGSVTPGHAAYFVSNGVIGDAGTSSLPKITSLGVKNNGGNGLCIDTDVAPASGYQQLCLSASLNSAAYISLQNYGTATPQSLNFVINGITYPFPGSLSQITVGTTPVVGGNSGNCLYVAPGNIVGQQTCAAGSIFALTGDVTASGPGTVPATLATVNSNVGTFGSASVVPLVTVNGKGLVTAISNATIALPASQITGTTLPTNIVTSSLTTVGTIGTGVWNGTLIGATYGGTGVNNGAKTITLGASFTTTGTTTPTLAFPNSTAFTYTFQNSSDTVVMLATNDTLTNKTLTTPTINGAALSGTFSGSPTLSGSNFVTNANIVQSAAATFKGNATAALANAADFTVQGLVDITSPNTTLDWIPVYNHTTGTIQKVNPSELTASVGSGVTSLNALAGTLTIANGGGVTVSPVSTIITLALDGAYTGLTADNCSLAATVSGGALTVALKTSAGADPTASTPCLVKFRSATATTGTITSVSVTSALSFSTGTTGSTFGSVNSTAFRLWVTAFNNAGTVVLGVSNQSTASLVYPINTGTVQSSTACSACTNATLVGVYYSTAAQTSEAIEILGYLEWASGLATAGTYASGPTAIQNFGLGIKKPGDIVQSLLSATGALTTTTNTYTPSDTPPTPSGGTNPVSQAITPTSAANILSISAQINLGDTGSSNLIFTAFVTQDASTSALFVTGSSLANATSATATLPVQGRLIAGTTSATTFKLYGTGHTGTINVNGAGGGRFYGGVSNTYIKVEEIMGELTEPANDNINPGVFSRVG